LSYARIALFYKAFRRFRYRQNFRLVATFATLYFRDERKSSQRACSGSAVPQSGSELVPARIIRHILRPVQTQRQANPQKSQNQGPRIREAAAGRIGGQSVPPGRTPSAVA